MENRSQFTAWTVWVCFHYKQCYSVYPYLCPQVQILNTRSSRSHLLYPPGANLRTQSTGYLTVRDNVKLFPETESPPHTPTSSGRVPAVEEDRQIARFLLTEWVYRRCHAKFSIWIFLPCGYRPHVSSLKCRQVSFANFSIRESSAYFIAVL